LNGERPKILLLGFTIPEPAAAALDVEAVAPQTQNFANALTDALQFGGADVTLLSALPVLDFPHGPLFVGRHDFQRFQPKSAGETIPFVNLMGLKHATRFVSCLIQGVRLLGRSPNSRVLVHGIHSPFLLAAVLMRRMTAGIFVVLTDPPTVILASDGPLRRFAKRVDGRIIRRLTRQFDGAISLTDDLARTLQVRSHITTEGIVNLRRVPSEAPPRATNSVFTIAYAGGLSQDYGVTNLLSAVQSFTSDETHLLICGSGPLEPHLQELFDPRISFLGTLDASAVQPVLLSADALVNPRPVEELAHLSFPSKLIEYMASGRPVISTALPTLSRGYSDHLVLTQGSSAEDLRRAIDEVRTWTPEARTRFGRAAREFILAQNGPETQGHRIAQYLQDPVGVRDPAG